MTKEDVRLQEDRERKAHWKRWGPYLSERQWGTVREDYSPDGTAWDSFSHDQARSRAYRWGEDGLAGISVHLLRPGALEWPRSDPQRTSLRPHRQRGQSWRGISVIGPVRSGWKGNWWRRRESNARPKAPDGRNTG